MTKKLICTPENPKGVLVDMTPEEIAAANASYQKAVDEKAQKQADEDAKVNLKASAKSKLIAGEPLTQEEADTIVI